ncbi:MAG: polyprenyl diphosphate synthase [Phycisphaerae bacterium]
MPTMERLDPQAVLGLSAAQLPRHVAIIMDGNGRWAQRRGWPRVRGHEAGAANVREIVRFCARLGIECLTLYSFSSENWRRPADEVGFLMDLYVRYLIRERDEILSNDIRLVQIGRRAGLPEPVLRELDRTVELSARNPGMTLCLAINYGARAELVDACQKLARRAAAGELAADEIDEQAISDALDTRGLPDPDLLIRTAGEMRISNFLLWQISYAELHVAAECWPDFSVDCLAAALRDFAGRRRRFGNVDTAAHAPDGRV